MFRANLRMTAIVVSILSVTLSGTVALEDPAADSKAIEGLWFGSWGGGPVGGVVFQPVLAEMFIRGNRVEMVGFPAVGRRTGNIRVDARARRVVLTPDSEAGGYQASCL